MEIQWWYWIVLGIALLLAELAIPAFVLLWFGAGAFVVGLLAALTDIGFGAQVMTWAVASSILTAVWFKFFKNPDRTKSGQSKEAFLGVIGVVTKDVSEMTRGEIEFQRPVLGSVRWPVISDESIRAGDKARIVDVLGQILKVAPVSDNR